MTSKSGKKKTSPDASSDAPGSAKKKSSPVPKATKAGLILSVSKVNRKMHQCKTRGVKRVGQTSPVYLTAAAEYLVEQIFEQAHAEAQKEKGHKKRITPAHIMAGIRNDKELNKSLAGLRVLAHDKVKGAAKWLQNTTQKQAAKKAREDRAAAKAAAAEGEDGEE